ncbi:MAG: hypothetical protein WKF85_14835 [Chitinophagaceae bacterium]
MQTQDKVKEMVKQKYSEIALQDKETNASSCCGTGGCSTEVYNIMSDSRFTIFYYRIYTYFLFNAGNYKCCNRQ